MRILTVIDFFNPDVVITDISSVQKNREMVCKLLESKF